MATKTEQAAAKLWAALLPDLIEQFGPEWAPKRPDFCRDGPGASWERLFMLAVDAGLLEEARFPENDAADTAEMMWLYEDCYIESRLGRRLRSRVEAVVGPV